MKSYQTISFTLIAGLFMLGLVGASLYVDWRIERERDALREQIQLIANEEVLLSERAKLTQLVEATATERDELGTYILDGDDGTVALLSELDRLAADLQLELETMNLEVVEKEDSFNQLVVGLQVVGRSSVVEQFILLLETIPYHSELTALTVRSERSVTTGIETTTANITISLSITNV